MCSCDRSCDSATASCADSQTCAGATLVGVINAALWATTHNEQCEAGDEDCPAKASCTCTACTKPKPIISNTKSTARHCCSRERSDWRSGFITKGLTIVYIG